MTAEPDAQGHQASKESTRDVLALPPPERLREIERQQNERARQIRERRAKEREADVQADDRTVAAQLIQRNYRGYRERRALKGHGLDASTRWMEAMKDVRYQNLTRPKSRTTDTSSMGSPLPRPSSSDVRDRWRRVGTIAHRAGSDDTSESEPELTNDADREQYAARKRAQKSQREKYAKVMGLEYFLEMVDHKHRYGSNLRRYHVEWKKADTRENFFYWLDHGEGKTLDLEDRPRKRLDTEQVRYLSREERKQYLVRIDHDGRFVWEKDGRPITTSPDFKDSINGIVPASDQTPTWREVTTGEKEDPATQPDSPDDASSISSATISTGSHEDASKYANPELHDAKGLAKLQHLSVDSLMNHLLRKTTKKNTWIFVADTSFRLYIGIKQSGAFQHSSFLKGARVSAAGLIKVKRGQLRKLSPLSGHYAPPVRNFREFLRSLRAAHADLSRLNVSRSYAVILGLEGYIGVKKRASEVSRGVKDLFDPQGKRLREEALKDKSQSAEQERRTLEREARERRTQSIGFRMMQRLGLEEEGEGDGGKEGLVKRERPKGGDGG